MVSKKTLVELSDEFASLECKDVTAEDMAPFYEADGAIVEKIVATLTNVESDMETKQQFAWEIVEELDNIVSYSDGAKAVLDIKNDLLEEAAETKVQLESFKRSIVEARSKVNMNAANIMNMLITNKKCNLIDVINQFDIFISTFNEHYPARPKQGRNNIHGQNIGKYIYERYNFHFGKPPQSGKGRGEHKDVKTDYDRLCDFIAEQYKILISYDARTITYEKRQRRDKNKSK